MPLIDFRSMRFLRIPTTLASVAFALGMGTTCGNLRGDVPLSITVRTAKGEAVADAAFALIPLDSNAPSAPADSRAHAEVVQQKEEFIPYVTVVQAGTHVEFPNRDSVQHHVYSLSKAKKFELPLYDPGRSESLVFDVSGTVTLGCNIHDWNFGGGHGNRIRPAGTLPGGTPAPTALEARFRGNCPQGGRCRHPRLHDFAETRSPHTKAFRFKVRRLSLTL